MITQEDIDHFADMQSPIMDMGYYQQEAVKTAIYTDPIIYPALGLGNEAGEVQGKVKKMLRDGTFNKDAIAAEIGDVLWYIAALCRDLEIDMAEVALKNLSKLKRDRKEELYKEVGITDELLYHQGSDMACSILCIRNRSVASVTGRQQEVL